MPLSFDATGFQHQDETSWTHPATGDHVVLEYYNLVPDLPAGLDDLPKLRHDLTVITGESGCLLEAHVVNFGGTPALLRLQKLPLPNQPSGQAFVASITVPKASCSAVLQIVCVEHGTTGVREAMLTAQLGAENFILDHPYAPGFTGVLPYHAGDDAKWDQQFPGHPLTRARAWLHHAMRTAQVDPGFAALPGFQPASPAHAAPEPPQAPEIQEPQVLAPSLPLRPGTRLHTVVTGIPVGGYLPIWFDEQTVMYWQMDEPDKVLERLGFGGTGRTPLADEWRRDALLFDLDNNTLWMAERYLKNMDGSMVIDQVYGRLAEFEEAEAAITLPNKMSAYQWIGRTLGKAVDRNEFIVVGPGGTQMYGSPTVLMVVLAADQQQVTHIEATPVPANAQIWENYLDPAQRNSQSMNKTITKPEDFVICGELAGFATEVWDVHPLHLALSFKQMAS
ncbi:MAG: hypothetical protein ABW224_10335 [Kibdelosporangium sp.]